MRKFVDLFKQYRGLRKEIYVIFFSRMITAMGAFVWPMLMLIMTRKIGMTEQVAGYILSGSAVLYLPASIAGGYLADHIGRKKVIVIFDSLVVLCFFLGAIVDISYLTIVFILLAGVFSTLEDPAHTSMIADISLPEERSAAYSLSYLGFNLGFVIGPMIGGFLLENHLHLAFFLDGLTTLISLVLLIVFVPETKSIAEESIREEVHNVYEENVYDQTTIEVIKSRKPIIFYFGMIILGSILYNQWGVTLPLYLGHLYGNEAGVPLGILYGINGAVVVLFTALVTMLLNEVIELKKFIIGTILQGLGFFLFVIDHRFLMLSIGIVIFTVGEIVNTIANGPYLSKRIPLSHRGKINGFLPIMYTLGHSVAPLIATQAIRFISYDIYWAIVFVFSIVLGGIYYLLIIPDQKTFPRLYESKDLQTPRNGV